MKKTSKGFTLIEMTIVLVLICLFGVALIPSMKLIYRQEIRKAADILCADLMTIKKQATSTQSIYTLTVDGTNKYYYTISPSLLNASITGKSDNSQDDISPKIKYSIRGVYEDGSTYVSNAICYRRGKLVDLPTATASEVSELIIKVTYEGTNEYAEIVYDGFIGRYNITIKS